MKRILTGVVAVALDRAGQEVAMVAARWAVEVGVNFSASNKRTVSVSWTSPRASVGSSFKAWATGTKATYQVQKWVGNKVTGEYRPRWRLIDTSGQLTAFTPIDGFAVGQ